MTDSEILNLILEKVNNLEKTTSDKFDRIDRQFDKIDEQFGKIDGKFDRIDERFGKIDERLDKIEKRFNKMDNRLDVIELKQDRTSKKLDNLELDVKNFERDIRRDIHSLNDQMETVIEVLKEHEFIPR